MRIGIVTFHHVINDGAVLQAYAQTEAIQRIFPNAEVEILDFRYRIIHQRERLAAFKDLVKLKRSGYYKMKKYFTVLRFVDSKLKLSDKRFVTNNMEEAVGYINQRYQALVVGSDEVWKISYKKYSRPFPNLYWLPSQLNIIRIASAASANTLKYDTLTGEDKGLVKKLLEGFQLIGVRDDFTYDLVKDHVGTSNLVQVPDPTFAMQFDERIYEQAKQKLVAAGADLKRPMVGISLSSDIPQLRVLSIKAYEMFRQHGMQVISIGQYNRYCDINLTANLDPLEWAHIYRYFEYCLTDRFHSTIFSIRNQVNFLSVDFANRYEGNEKGKIFDLLQRVDLIDHYINLRSSTVEEALNKIDRDIKTNRTASVTKLKIVDQRLHDDFMNFGRKMYNVILGLPAEQVAHQ